MPPGGIACKGGRYRRLSLDVTGEGAAWPTVDAGAAQPAGVLEACVLEACWVGGERWCPTAAGADLKVSGSRGRGHRQLESAAA